MSESEPIYVDASLPATLRHPGGSIDCYTVQEAKMAWDRLSAKDREQSTIKVNVTGGAVYSAQEIDRLHYGPKPAGS
jgi:hypothetical protein